jgi:hypothetical protein
MLGLLKSRKFWIAIIAVVQTILLDGLGVSMEIWGIIDGIAAVLIGSIAWEDAAAKSK